MKNFKLSAVVLILCIASHFSNNASEWLPFSGGAAALSGPCKGTFFGDMPNADALIAYVEGYSKNNDFLYKYGTKPLSLDICVYNAIKSEADKINTCYFGNSVFRDGTMMYGDSNSCKTSLANPSNWPTQTKLNIASAINRNCNNPYTQFDYTSSVFSNFLKTYMNTINTILKPIMSCQ